MGGSNLKGFLSKFNSSQGKFVDKVDTLQTFDLKFKFYPEKKIDNESSNGFLKKALVGVSDNLTGGLVTAFTQDEESINTKRDEWKKGFDETNRSFMEQLTQGVLLDPDIKTNVVLDLSYYAQVANVPAIQIQENGVVETDIGTFPINGKIVKPS